MCLHQYVCVYIYIYIYAHVCISRIRVKTRQPACWRCAAPPRRAATPEPRHKSWCDHVSKQCPSLPAHVQHITSLCKQHTADKTATVLCDVQCVDAQCMVHDTCYMTRWHHAWRTIHDTVCDQTRWRSDCKNTAVTWYYETGYFTIWYDRTWNGHELRQPDTRHTTSSCDAAIHATWGIM